MIKAKNNNTYNLSRIAAVFIFIFALLIFITAFYPAGWNWGFHFLAFYDIEIIILIPILLLLFTIPAIQDFFIDRLSSFSLWFSKKPRALRIVLTVAALGGLALLFWIFRVKSFFLGDSPMILRGIQNITSIDQIAGAYKREPLVGSSVFLLTKIFVFLKRSNPGLDAYCWLSILTGIIFVLAAWRFVERYSEDRIEQFLLYILLITSGISQLFFGYMENYAPSAAGILLFLLFAILYLKGNISITWVIFIYGITFLFHFGTLIFLPALVFLFYFAIKRKQTKELVLSLFLTILILFSLLHLFLYPLELFKNILSGTGQHIVAFSSPLNKYQAYTFFSISHVIDLINFFFLAYPAISMLFILSGIIFWKKHRALPLETKFLLLAALCGSTFIIIFNCEIGMSRDWDILAPMSLGIPAAAIALWKMIEYEKKVKHRILIMLCIVSLLHTGLWVGLNADEIRAEERFKTLEDNRLWSKHAKLDAYEELAVYYRERGDYEKAIQYYQRYVTLDSSNQRLWRNIAEIYLSTGQKNKAKGVYTTMIRLGMGNYKTLTSLGMLYVSEYRLAEAMIFFKQAEKDAPENPIVKYNIGVIITLKDKAYKKAIPYFLDAIRFDSTFSEAYNAAAECYSQLGDSVQARQLTTKSHSLSVHSNK